MFKIEDIAGTEFNELLQQMHLGELNVVDLRIIERLDILEELLGVVLAPVDDTLSTSGMEWEVSGVVFPWWMLRLMGMEIALIDVSINIHLCDLFTYLNEFLIILNQRGVWVSEVNANVGWEDTY